MLRNRKVIVLFGTTAVLAATAALAQYPILDAVANKVIEKYQTSSCEQLWQKKGQPPGEQEQRVIGLLKSDAAMREHFLSKVAGPIANKMFECGMIP
ncbi:MAG TPA: hypothetical protein PKC97_07280 [Burkholderiaceae bacterium]|nr:hypothetical protein [Burkholderiaceae bacterium]